jgi:L,D-peptidoglycan transpeptidase YkuD (ErfK/YbiS/YcfS/YnhG family)
MPRPLQGALVAGAIALMFGAASPAREAGEPKQLVVVVADDASSTVGELRRFARAGGKWRVVGESVRVSLGRHGLSGDKREGDGKSPAGRFALGLVTGYDATPPAGARMPYRQATPSLRCVDDVHAAEYNREVEAPDGGARWSSDEAMRRDDEQYRLTVFVAHNAARTPGQGSCIFLHVWQARDVATSGCTAMALSDLRALVTWLDPAAHPELIQLPRREYEARQRDWDLPPLGGRRK